MRTIKRKQRLESDLIKNNKTSDTEITTTIEQDQIQKITTDSTTLMKTDDVDFKIPPPIDDGHSSMIRKSKRLKRLNNVQQQTSMNNEFPQQQSQPQQQQIAITNNNNSECSSNNSNSNANSNSGTAVKSLRKIQSWTEDDIRWFFEALAEHGKDFPHIQSYIASRCEKKGIASESIKNYEQVRHFYYRMWHKISQILTVSNDVEKVVQELYGLINYGEIWKRFGTKIDYHRLSINLQQLIDYGYTVIKMKGKNVRIRTPICNALKKINNIDISKIQKPITQPSMPKEIIIELIPATNADWIRVQSLAQNPRLRTKLSMQQRLSTLIEYLEKRWIQQRSSSSNDVNNTSSRIRLRPQQSAKLSDVILKSTTNSISYHSNRSTTTHGHQSSLDISLSSYMKNNMFNDGNGLTKKSKLNQKKSSSSSSTTTKSTAKNNTDIENETEQTENETTEQIKTDNISISNTNVNSSSKDDLFKLLDSMNEELETRNEPIINQFGNNNYYEQHQEIVSSTNDVVDDDVVVDEEEEEDGDNDDDNNVRRLPEPPANQTLAQWLAGGVNDNNDNDLTNDDEDDKTSSTTVNINPNYDEEPTTDPCDDPSKIKSNKQQQNNNNNEMLSVVEMLTVEKARTGWTIQEAKAITIGEIYLLYCQPKKIVLEYCWLNSGNNGDVVVVNETKPPLNTIQKFLIAANMALMNFKKSSINNNMAATTTTTCNTRKQRQNNNNNKNQTTTTTSSTTTTTTSTVATTTSTNNTNSNSELLSNLIQQTIFNDQYQQQEQLPENNKNVAAAKTKTTTTSAFASKNYRSTALMLVNDTDDKIDEVLKELKNCGRRTIVNRPPVNRIIYNNAANMIRLVGSIHHHQPKKLSSNQDNNVIETTTTNNNNSTS